MSFALTRRARNDIKSIARYTVENFGSLQMEEYLNGLYYSFELLSENLKMGREWMPGRRRYIYRMHHIYYRLAGDDVLITHIRHASQNPL